MRAACRIATWNGCDLNKTAANGGDKIHRLLNHDNTHTDLILFGEGSFCSFGGWGGGEIDSSTCTEHWKTTGPPKTSKNDSLKDFPKSRRFSIIFYWLELASNATNIW